MENLFVVSVTRNRSGSRGMFLNKDKALAYAEQTAADPEVTYVEVREYNTVDLLNAALDELEDASREDEEIENGELVALFQ